jgi:predicted GIY-YIG superfamily endonuclease
MTYTVYTCLGDDSTVLYVGVTSRGDKRLAEHARGSAWFDQVVLVTREYMDTAHDAGERERQLIAEHTPQYNKPAPRYSHEPLSTDPSPDLEPGEMTLAQMATALGLKDAAGLRRLCESGAIRAEKLWKTWLVPDDEVERYRLENLGKRGRPPKQPVEGDKP